MVSVCRMHSVIQIGCCCQFIITVKSFTLLRILHPFYRFIASLNGKSEGSMKCNNIQLINRSIDGDDTAFAELVEKYQKQVHALVWRKVGDFHIAEEITQDTFLNAYQNLTTLKRPQQFASWLYVIATNRCTSWLRKKHLRKQLLKDNDTTHRAKPTYSDYKLQENERITAQTQRDVVKKLLGKLEESERTVITLHYFGEMSCSEIGAFLGVSENTVKSRLRRARQRLKKEETIIREAIDNFQISPHLTENVMREISHVKPTLPTSSKPFLPWAITTSTLAVVLLMLGFGNSSFLTRFQKPYSLDATAEMTIEIIDAPIVMNLEHKPDIQKQIGSAFALEKRISPEQQPNDILAALAETQGDEKMEDPTTNSSSQDVTIPDANLAAAIRKTLGIGPTDPIPKKKMEELEQLHANEKEIRDLTGLEKATGLKRLSLNRNRISDLTALTNLTQLTSLSLDDNNINDITPLTGLTKLKYLAIVSNQVRDLTPIANLAQLADLRLINNQIRDITPIADLTKLTKLRLHVNKITNIEPLEKLTELKELILQHNQIKDISCVQSLTNLERLSLYGNPIQNVAPLERLLKQNPKLKTDISAQRPSSTELDPTIPDVNLADVLREKLDIELNDPIPIEKLKTLKKLDASNRNIVDLTGLQNATNLKVLIIAQNKITDLKPLANLTQLTELWLHYTPISDLTPLANLTKLTKLYSNDNQISDITPLIGLTQLESVILINNQIVDITPLKGLTKLREIMLAKNKIADITPLSELTQLQFLDLINNQINDITPLTGMTELTTLWIAENQINNLTPLTMLTKLKSLSLWKNNITHIEAISGLSHLEVLDLSRNQIQNIIPLANLTKLRKLRLHSNKITNIEPLESMTKLVELNLGGNQIMDISPISGKDQLTKLWLWSNQIKDISPIAGATLLSLLHIERNQIYDISSIEKFTRLTDLKIKKNFIQDMDPLGELLKVNSDMELDIPPPVELNIQPPPENR
ncbi:hypothetical protein C6497_04330 [Candidatus Poribacteria bacterium]|nr:MAG: hypothetical protein C6497_04330 [Candidatus Poribacteria bacterium]